MGVAAMTSALLVALAQPADASTESGTPTTKASACQGGGAKWPDCPYILPEPYSMVSSKTVVRHVQWRRNDTNYITAETSIKNTWVLLERTDGRICGPVALRWSSSMRKYTGSVAHLYNPGHGVRACKIQYGLKLCGKWKRE